MPWMQVTYFTLANNWLAARTGEGGIRLSVISLVWEPTEEGPGRRGMLRLGVNTADEVAKINRLLQSPRPSALLSPDGDRWYVRLADGASPIAAVSEPTQLVCEIEETEIPGPVEL